VPDAVDWAKRKFTSWLEDGTAFVSALVERYQLENRYLTKSAISQVTII